MSLTLVITRPDGTTVSKAIDQNQVSIQANAGEHFHIVDEHGVVINDFVQGRDGDSMTITGLPDFTALELCGFYGDDSEPCALITADGANAIMPTDAPIMVLAQNKAATTETATDAGAAATASGSESGAAAAGGGISTTAIVVGGVLGVGVIAAASGGSSSSPTPAPTPGPGPAPTPNAPSAPTNLDVEGADSIIDGTEAADGVTITGTAEAGSTVNISWGTATTTATAAGDGSFTATIAAGDVPANGSYDVTATATNSSGTGPAATLSNVVAAASNPATPTGLDVEGDDAIIDATEAADGVTITGNAEAGSTVAITWGGFTDSVIADASGNYTSTAALGSVPLDGSSQISVTATNATGTSAAQTLDVTVNRGAGGSGTGVTVDGNTTIQNAGDITGTANNDVLVGGAGGDIRNGEFDFWETGGNAGASVLDPGSQGGAQFVTLQGANGGTQNPNIGWSFLNGATFAGGAGIGSVGNNQYDPSQPNIDPGFGEIELTRAPTGGAWSWESVNSGLSGGAGITQTVLTENGQTYSLTINFDNLGSAHQTAGTSFQISWNGAAIAFFDATANAGAGNWVVSGGDNLAAPTSATASSWTFANLAATGSSAELTVSAYEHYTAGGPAAISNDGIGLHITHVQLASTNTDGDETIDGAAGADLIYGQGGNDTLTGGDQADTFVYSMSAANGGDTITDFTVGSDRIMLINVADTVSTNTLAPGDGSQATESTRSYTNLGIEDLLGTTGNQMVTVSDSGGSVMLTFVDSGGNAVGSTTLTGVSSATYVGADNTASLTNLRNAGILDWTNDGFNTGLI